MELFKSSPRCSELNYVPPNNSRLVKADIVFVDKTREAALPTLYVLEDELNLTEDFEVIKDLPFTYCRYILIGLIDSIDEAKKMVILENGNAYSYHHLITAYDANYKEDTFTKGLRTLIDAIKCRKKILPALPNTSEHIMVWDKHPHSTEQNQGSQIQIKCLAKENIQNRTKQDSAQVSSGLNQLLYTVQF